MKKISIFLALLLVAGNACAKNTADSYQFNLLCKSDRAETAIQFKSVSGEMTEDDMIISIMDKGKFKKLAIKPGWFHDSSQQSNMTPACIMKEAKDVSYPAFFINNSTLAIFLIRDGRPGYSSLEVALIDTQKHELLDIQPLGLMKTDLPVIQPYQNGYKIRVVRETNIANCDCADAYADDWKTIAIQNDRIVSKWLKD